MEALLNPALLLFISGILIGTLFKLILPNSISKYLGYYLLLSLGLKGGASLQENGFINFKKGGELILKDYLFNSEEGIFDKNKLFVDFTDGETYINNRGFVISFKKLTGNLDNQITLEDISMTSCKDPKKWLAIKC